MGILQKLAALGLGKSAKPTSAPVDLTQIMDQKTSDMNSVNSGGIQRDVALKAVKEKVKSRRGGKATPKKEDKVAKAVSALKGFKGKKK